MQSESCTDKPIIWNAKINAYPDIATKSPIGLFGLKCVSFDVGLSCVKFGLNFELSCFGFGCVSSGVTLQSRTSLEASVVPRQLMISTPQTYRISLLEEINHFVNE